jgi:hypothetical protein
LLKEIAREEGGREVRRGEREYMSQREREGGRERERRSWVQGSERKRGTMASNLKVMGCCCSLSNV